MDAAASLNKVKSHQTLSFSISGPNQDPPQLNQTQTKVIIPLSPFHGTDDIQYLMYKKSSQSPRKNRQQPKETLPKTQDSLQNHLHVTTQPSSDQNAFGGASTTQRETLSHSGQRIMSMTSKKKKSKGGRRKRKHTNRDTTSEEEQDEQKNIVRELIDEEGSMRNLELEPRPLLENTRNMEGWNATSERSLSLPKIGRQQQQLVNSKKVNQQLNNSMANINSPYAIPQTVSQHIFSKQRASQQLKPMESSQVFMHVRKTEDYNERKPPVSLKIRQPTGYEEEEDLYDDEIVEPARKKKSKPEILTGWNNNRHPIFLNQSQSDAQMKQITNRKKSVKTQRNPIEE